MSDQELKLSMAKMLPEKIIFDEGFNRFHWLKEKDRTSSIKTVHWPEIQDTEWPHICQEIERRLTGFKRYDYNAELFKLASGVNLASAVNRSDCIFAALTASWKQRAEALCKVRELLYDPA